MSLAALVHVSPSAIEASTGAMRARTGGIVWAIYRHYRPPCVRCVVTRSPQAGSASCIAPAIHLLYYIIRPKGAHSTRSVDTFQKNRQVFFEHILSICERKRATHKKNHRLFYTFERQPDISVSKPAGFVDFFLLVNAHGFNALMFLPNIS